MNDTIFRHSQRRFVEFASEFQVHSKAVEALLAKISDLISPALAEPDRKQSEAFAQAVARIDPAIPRDLEKTAQTLHALADKLEQPIEMPRG